MYGYVYMFTNRINGKKYIGQHKSEEIDQSYFGSGYIFKEAREKYGLDNFKFDILAICKNQNEMDNAERHFIGFTYYSFADIDNDSRGYNIASGGNGGNPLYAKTNEEKRLIREKIKETWKNKPQDIKDKIAKSCSDRFKGVPKTSEENEKNRQAHLGKHCSEETKRRISENHARAMLGKKHKESTKKKMSDKAKRNYCVELNGNITEYIGREAIAKAYGLTLSTVKKIIVKKQPHIFRKKELTHLNGIRIYEK